MSRISIIGSTGMIGSTCTRLLSTEFEVTEINRFGKPVVVGNRSIPFDILNDPINNIAPIIDECDYVINLSGHIRHRMTKNSADSVRKAIKINSVFPIELISLFEKSPTLKILNIGTDCIYSGSKGNYLESDQPDPVDAYGITKQLGEFKSLNQMTLRTSIIGHELQSQTELLDWFLNMPKRAIVHGFTNHIWNGLTSLHFGKILRGVIKKDNFSPGNFHITPADKVSKFDLLKLASIIFERHDIVLKPEITLDKVDRSLSTSMPESNLRFWRDAGYISPPRIKDMMSEYADWEKVSNYSKGSTDVE